MTRELKFRIWNKEESEYMVLGATAIDAVTGQVVDYYWEGRKLEKENYIVEQYTGLKDKNGKEIYEGDIVRHGETILEIKFDKIKDSDFTYYYLGWIMECDKYSPDSLCEYNDAVEVIGNIHENPELLGDEE